jgi:phenol hydroxylase P1 protein
MQIDLRTVNIEPLRNTFDHLVRRFGDKPASRYQEGSYDLQAAENLHYRPTWDPEQELYDPNITRIVMQDWYALKDPRQFYYTSYTLARARQQDTANDNFAFVEERGLLEMLPEAARRAAAAVLVPLRHAAWGANQNNALICGYGYGTVFTQPCIYQAMDNLGIAQYLSRIGLQLGGEEALAEGKRAWQDGAAWQPLRHLVEDTMALRDPFEVFVAQNLVLDGLLYPLVYERYVDRELPAQGAAAIAMLTQFMTDWFGETSRWVDAVIKTAAAESAANRDVLAAWSRVWIDRAAAALLPVMALALGSQADAALDAQVGALQARLAKCGVNL